MNNNNLLYKERFYHHKLTNPVMSDVETNLLGGRTWQSERTYKIL